MYWPGAAGETGCGPRGLAWVVSPLPLRMKIRRPSLLNRAAVGYQPVGMNPRTRAGARTGDVDHGDRVVVRVGHQQRAAVRREPQGVGRAARRRGRIEGDRDLLRRRPRGQVDHPDRVGVGAGHEEPAAVLRQDHGVGVLPHRDLALAGASVAASKRRTLAPPQRETSSVLPSGVGRAVYPSAGSATFRTTSPVRRSTSERSFPRACTAKRREPSGAMASPPTKLDSAGFSSWTDLAALSSFSVSWNSSTVLAPPPET